jgi:hypothetical protein
LFLREALVAFVEGYAYNLKYIEMQISTAWVMQLRLLDELPTNCFLVVFAHLPSRVLGQSQQALPRLSEKR